MKVFVVEDDPIFSLKLESMLAQLADYEYVGKAASLVSARKGISKLAPDIVICDVRLQEDASGIDLATEFEDKAICFIFVTAFSDEGVYDKSKELTCSKFIVKPFDILTLKGLLDDIKKGIVKLSATQSVLDNTLFIKKNNVFQKVLLSDLNYFYSEGNYITFFCDKKKYILKYSLTKLLQIPKFADFERIHRSYAVHKRKIENINFAEKLVSVSGVELPFGRTYVKSVRSLMDVKFQ